MSLSFYIFSFGVLSGVNIGLAIGLLLRKQKIIIKLEK